MKAPPSGLVFLEKAGLILLSGMLFSVTIAGVTIAGRYIPPATLTAWRLLIAAIVFAGLLLARRPGFRWQVRGVVDIAVIGLLNIGLPFLGLAIAVKYISSSLAAVLFNTIPIFTVVVAHFVLPDERLNRIKLLGTLIAVAGASLMLTSNASGLVARGPQGWIGQVLVLAASFLAALGVIYTRLRLRDENVFILAGGQVFACLAILLPVALVFEGLPTFNYPWPGWVAMTVAAISGPVAGFWIVFHMIHKYSASLASFSGITTPLFSVLIGLAFLGEVLTMPMAIGTACLLLGVWSLNYF